MIRITPKTYDQLDATLNQWNGDRRLDITLLEFLNGFDVNKNNAMLKAINQRANNLGQTVSACTSYIVDDDIKYKYHNIDFVFDIFPRWFDFEYYQPTQSVDYKNFLCSFNGTEHVSRQLLLAALSKFGYYDLAYCTKNFKFTIDTLDGNLQSFVGARDSFWRKFFIGSNSEEFFASLNSFGHNRYNHAQNIYSLEKSLVESFVHVISESLATSYYPYYTEKAFYSVVTKGLFVAYAQPGWHRDLTQYFGFKHFTKLFDYRFDQIQNPVERLIEMLSMLAKFKNLSPNDWQDLRLLEQDVLDFNYDHYMSRAYLKILNSKVKTNYEVDYY